MKCLRMGNAILCGDFSETKICVGCGAKASLLCDWKTGSAKEDFGARVGAKTCDASLCEKCAQEVGPDKHLCPTHQAAYKTWLDERAKLRGDTGQGPSA